MNTTESYGYDPVGNSGFGSPVDSTGVHGPDRLSSLNVPSYTVNTSNEVTAAGGVMYTYDNNGNTTSKTDSTGTTNYSWDYENRLTQVTLPGQGGTVQFKYDPFGRRIYKSSTSGTATYAYDGDNAVETTNQSGGILSRFAQGQNIDEPLAESTSSGIDYYEADGLGSITSLTNGVGTVSQTYTYDSFGNTTHSTGSLANPFQYTAREFDSETGLYYYRARYYDPTTGRFLSEDPLRFGIGPKVHFRAFRRTDLLFTPAALRGRSADFYSYASNDPVGVKDPRGLWQFTIGGGDLIGGLITFGHNNGQWNLGFYGGAGAGLFANLDTEDVDCECGLNLHAEGDLGIIGEDLEGISFSVNISGEATTGSISVADPMTPVVSMQWDTGEPTPTPTIGGGLGGFSGAGYTFCW